MILSKQKDKKIGIFGLGITGKSVYQKLIYFNKEILCYDDSQTNREIFINQFGNQTITSLDNKKWTQLDKIVISPGIPHSHAIFQLASQNNILISSDIELFIEENPASEFIFITGTNGKSTVTALTEHILTKAGLGFYIGGNIGKPVMSLPFNEKGYIVELSSFQLELLNKINPNISVITNITPDHLDRYETIEEYTQAKEKILAPNALKIIGINSVISKNIYLKLKKIYGVKILPISNLEKIKNGIFCNDERLEDNFFDQKNYLLSKLPHLQGSHNKENIAIAYALCRALLVAGSFIIKALESFKGLNHRMQYIGSCQNIDFYNDSKATNISSSLASLSSFENIIWFAGGKFKENSFDELKPILKNIKKAYFFGESKNLFANFLDSSSNYKPEYEICDNLEEAFDKAIKYSKNKTKNGKLTFLLAPACASYDQFKNFEERGKFFSSLVENIITLSSVDKL